MTAKSVAVVGDRYEYKIKASSRKAAFKKLVDYFYGSGSHAEIQSKHEILTNRAGTMITGEGGMPNWFARCVSGEGSKEDFDKLERYRERM